MVSVITTEAGRDALDTLGQRLGSLRSASPLDPALVVCTGPIVAVGLRRALGRRSGIAGIETTTVSGLVRSVLRNVGGNVGGRGGGEDRVRLASKPELLVAIRAELSADPGAFGPVAGHRTTDERLLAFQQELSGVAPGPMQLMEREAEGLSRDALRVIRRATERPEIGLSGDRLVEAFAAAMDDVPAGALGPIIVYQPEPLRAFEGRVLQALARRRDVEIVVSLTGHHSIDDAYLDRLAGWGIRVDPGPTPSPVPASMVEVADPDDEVRAAIRTLSAQTTVGVALCDTAILYGHAEPYAAMITSHLQAAGIPYGGPGFRPLSSSLAGRTLRRLLDLTVNGLDRSAVMTFLSASPIDDGTGRAVPAGTWDRLSRQAGVIDDDHWHDRLSLLAETLPEPSPSPYPAADAAPGSTPGSTAGPGGVDGAAITALGNFIEELRRALAPPAGGRWSELSRWAEGLLDRYLLVGDWPDEELMSNDRVRSVLADLGRLDRLGASVDVAGFEAALSAELNSLRMPGRPLGQGVYVGPVESAAGLSFERVCVVGLAEGRYPRSPLEDSLLTDRLRSRAGLLEKSQITGIDVRHLALVAAGSRRPALFFTARGDLRSNRSRAWPLVVDPLVDHDQDRRIDSHYAGLAQHGRPSALEELELRSLIGHVEAGDPVHTHPLALSDPVLAAGLERHRGRDRRELGPHTGRVGAGRIDPLQRPLSPTALETYARCPRRYLLGRVLRIRETERPERIAEITALQRGSLVHRVLERFLGDMIDQDEVPEPDRSWSTAQRAHLLEVLAQEMKQAESLGYTGGQVRTALLHRRLISWMDAFLDTDNRLRARLRSTPVHVELAFGMDDEPPLSRWAGRSMRLRGAVDRVDITDDGGIVIIDYKTGRGSEFRDLADNPLKEGTRLQLPLYANDVANRLGRTGPKLGVYWLVAENDVATMAVDTSLEERLEEVVGTILDGVGDGLFPGVPGETDTWRSTFTNCRHCEFERICPTDRQREWSQVRHDPALASVSALIDDLEPDADSRPGSGS